ncbi:MAG: hypothetical protein QXG18_02055 [Candidatus Pacearchaeota archaeon]
MKKHSIKGIIKFIEKKKSFLSKISKKDAPITKGINIKKEKSKASSFFTPRILAEDIVIPLLEIPGNKERI